jgi:enterobactin synthetase component F
MTDDLTRSDSTSVEEALRAMWAETFGLAEIGLDDDFFALGGHSALAARICVRIGDELGIHLPLTSFLESPTIAELGERIREIAAEGSGGLDAVVPRRDEPSLTELLAEIESLSDAEVRTALTEADRERP